jgi:Asp-tRNA(Asn)/Glu-tRNA(Gln) amidotransferase B subunit
MTDRGAGRRADRRLRGRRRPEVHVELATATKLFSGSPNRFGDEPNTNIDPVTLGLPGSLRC